MTTTADTADQLEALARQICDPATQTGLSGPSADVGAQLAALIAGPMQTIDGRTLATDFRYTLNITNALQLRAKHWYLYIDELTNTAEYRTSANFELVHPDRTVTAFASSFGATLGLATCAAICNVWASVIRLWLAGNYSTGG